MPITKRGGGKSSPKLSKLHKFAKRKQSIFAQGELAEVNSAIAKKNGKSQIFHVASDKKADYGRLPTGIITLDLGLAGGWKESRGHMIYGEKSAGKTTVALKTVAAALRRDPDCAAIWVDVEGTFDRVWAKALGVDMERLLIVEPEYGEQALDLVDAYIQTREVAIVVTDSIAFISPQKELEESVEKSLVGNHALLIGKFLRKVNQAIIRERHRGHYVISLYLNQFRMKIGVMFGDPRTLPGGKALEFTVSQNVLMHNKEHLYSGKGEDGVEVGTVLYNEHGFRITKDKTGGRIKEGVFKLIRDPSTGYTPGYIEQSRSIISFAQNAGLYTGSTRSHQFEGIPHTFKTIEEVQRYFFENQDKQRQLCEKIVAAYTKRWGLE